MNIQSHNQAGVGLIEVMVALLLLAVAILGFSALQMRAVKATDESLYRTQAMTIVRSLSENLRDNPNGIATYKEVINDPTKAGSITKSSCKNINAVCTTEEIATQEALATLAKAGEHEMSLALIGCPGTAGFSEVQCIIVAWGETLASLGTDANACADDDGIYKVRANCLIIEAY